MRRGWLIVVLLVVGTPVWAAGVYKWVDEQGRVHYGDKPQGGQAESVDVKSEPGTSSAPAVDLDQTRQRLLQAYEEERLEREQKRAEAAKEAERRKQNCARAKDELRNLETASYLYDFDEKGERVILNDAEHARALARARADVKEWCSP